MQYSQLISRIQADIYNNGAQLITGDILQGDLLAIISALASAGAGYGGIITPGSSAPASLDQATFYLAIQPGTYSSFGVTVTEPSIVSYGGGSTLTFTVSPLGLAPAPTVVKLNTGDNPYVLVPLTGTDGMAFTVDIEGGYSGGDTEVYAQRWLVNYSESHGVVTIYVSGDKVSTDMIIWTKVYEDNGDLFLVLYANTGDLDYVTMAFRDMTGDPVPGITVEPNITGYVYSSDAVLTNPEYQNNKVTFIGPASSNIQYPSAKAVYEALSGKQATINTVNVSVSNTTGTPSGTASVSGSTMNLSFSGIKGEKGDTGATGPQGPQGNTGSSVDYPFELANNLTTDDPTKALSAAQGVVLEGEISQLGQEVDELDDAVNGGEETQTVTNRLSAEGKRIPKNGKAWTASSATGFNIDGFDVVAGKTYHLLVPGMSNAYTAVYSFGISGQGQTALPSPVVSGPVTNAEYDIVIPDGITTLYVCYEVESGRPTLTTTVQADGLVGRVGTLEGKTETIEGEIDSIEEEINEIITDTNNTLYENEGQVAYYRNLNTKSGWNGVGTTTPALTTDVTINQVVFPPFMTALQGSTLKYFIGHRVYDTSVINTPETALTKIVEGTIENVGPSLVSDFAVTLQTAVTIPAGHQVIILLYNATGNVFFLGGGVTTTTNLPYNSEDARAFFTETSGYVSPFEEYWSIATDKTTAQYKVCNPVLKYVKDSEVTKAIKEQVPEIVPGIVDEYLEDKNEVKVYLPNKLYAVVGDTLQLFFQGIVGVVNISDYDIYAECSKGKTFPRYFSYTPVVADVGTTTLSVYVRDRNGIILGRASCDLVTVSAPSSPASAKSVFTFGDSLTSQGQWPGEAKRRLVGNSTYDSIAGKGLSNIAFYGYMNKTINGQSVNYFGVGGWTWANYLSKGTGGAFRFFVEGVSSLSIGAVYTNNGYSYTVQEINITGDSGNIRCTTSANTNTPSASGTLTKTSGDGDATITFASYETENANPLWDDTNNKMSFIPYVQACGANTIDAVYVLLSWNGQGSWKEYSVNDATGHIADAKTFARTLHTEYPSAKLFIMGLQMPSDTGGLGYNYGASGGLIDGQGVKQTAFNYNKALQDLCNLDEFSPYCEFVAVAPQFDSHYNMPYSTVKANTRNNVTEMLGRNGVHPSDPGYFQIADAVYRSVVANFCQLTDN